MSKSKHTPGPWTVIPAGQTIQIRGPIDPHPLLPTARQFVANTGFNDGPNGSKPSERQIANARMIAEAGTVAHETGRTPRQLADELAELLAALKAAVERMEAVAEGIIISKRHNGVSPETHVYHMAGHLAQHAKLARAAIAKAEGGAA